MLEGAPILAGIWLRVKLHLRNLLHLRNHGRATSTPEVGGRRVSQQMPELLKTRLNLRPRRIRAVAEQATLSFVFGADRA